ncbi:MAG: flagellar basal-body rod modification protein FlgD [Bacteroidetes bacterium HLUCCA01]|nr:MAG: flagellar basal-body rod modification protein FlgD [Bacteroidetes bacterium HLUCCA01]
MNINAINQQSSFINTAQNAGKGKEMGQQQFLQLLVAQMRHQDPTNPMNGSEFASQLAQFNSVEQLINVNTGIQSLQESQDVMSAGLTNSLAASLTGKEVKAYTDGLYLPQGEAAQVNYRLASSANEVTIVIRNQTGAEVRRETVKSMPSGDNMWQWDGRNNSGDRMADGNYTVSIEATAGENPVNVLPFVEGIASKVSYSAEGVFLTVNGVPVHISDVEEIRAPKFGL